MSRMINNKAIAPTVAVTMEPTKPPMLMPASANK